MPIRPVILSAMIVFIVMVVNIAALAQAPATSNAGARAAGATGDQSAQEDGGDVSARSSNTRQLIPTNGSPSTDTTLPSDDRLLSIARRLATGRPESAALTNPAPGAVASATPNEPSHTASPARPNPPAPLTSVGADGQDRRTRTPIGLGAARRAPTALGTAGETSEDTPNRSGGFAGSWMLKTLGALGLVIALIFVCRAVMMRWSGRTSAATGSAGVELLSRVAIGPRCYVHLVRVNTRVLVVGESPGGLSSLANVEDPEEVAGILAAVTSDKPMSVSAGFTQMMHQFQEEYTPRMFGRRHRDEGADDQEIHVDKARDQLSGLLSRLRLTKRRQLAMHRGGVSGVKEAGP